MTQIQVGSAERRLAQWVIYAVLAAPIIAILPRDLGVGPVSSWVIYAIIAAPMMSAEAAVVPLQRLERAEQSTLWLTASEDGASAACVGVRLAKSFAVGRTKANVNPPAPVPQITGADT
jgi:hypothetical protein